MTLTDEGERRFGDAAAFGNCLNPKNPNFEIPVTGQPATLTRYRERAEPSPTNTTKRVFRTLERMTES